MPSSSTPPNNLSASSGSSKSSTAPASVADWSAVNMAVWAAQGRVDERDVPLALFTRLVDEAVADVGDAQVHVALKAQERDASLGASEALGKQVWLRIEAHTHLPLMCQRCLTPVSTQLLVSQDLRFVASEDQAAFEDEESEEDVLALELSLDVLALVEDELIMAMPIVPLHDDCQPDGYTAEPEVVEEKPNPFAALAALKKPQ
jgi:uncharacterized protein